MIKYLQQEQDLVEATNEYKSAQATQSKPVTVQPLILLPSRNVYPPPDYNAEGI